MERFSQSEGGFAANPQDPAEWQRLIDALQPAAMLVRIEGRMSSELKQQVSAEDIWQETLLCAWRDREQLEWQGLPAFRRWLMGIAEHRIQDAVERCSAAKRDGGNVRRLVASVDSADGTARGASSLQARERTPPSAAVHAERARAMREALDSLPELYREVLRLRLFEEWDRDRIATRLGLSIPAVKHRIRLGAALYRESLVRVLSSLPGVTSSSHDPAARP